MHGTYGLLQNLCVVLICCSSQGLVLYNVGFPGVAACFQLW
jgi:hypothetical protein